jgi:hypothetical protein
MGGVMRSHDEVELEEAQELLASTLAVQWGDIQKAIKENDDVLNISLSLRLDHVGRDRILKCKVSHSTRVSTEDERLCRDPMQPELKFNAQL